MILLSPINNPKLAISPIGRDITINSEPVAPYSRIAWGKGATEPEGVDDRRIAISHAFAQEDVDFAVAAGFTAVTELPADWRYLEVA